MYSNWVKEATVDFVKLLQSIEGGIYEVVAWAILFPKTILTTIFKPSWGTNYIDAEWEKKEDERFNEFLSPGLLWLLVSILQILFRDPILTAAELFRGMPYLPAFIESIKGLKAESLLAIKVLFLMVYPFIYLVWMEWINKTPIQKSTLRRNFQIQCYALAPAQFLGIVFPLLGFLFIWFYEVFVFRSEFKTSWLKAIWHGIAPQILLIVAFLAIAFFAGFIQGFTGG